MRARRRCEWVIREYWGGREFFIGNLLVRIHFIIEMISVDQPCAMGVVLGSTDDRKRWGTIDISLRYEKSNPVLPDTLEKGHPVLPDTADTGPNPGLMLLTNTRMHRTVRNLA